MENTNQIRYFIYKISNTVNDMIYIGSTCIPLKKRMNLHRNSAFVNRDNNKFYNHMNGVGINKFSIKLIKDILVSSKKVGRIQEQIEIWNIPKDKRLNTIRAHIPYKSWRSYSKKRQECMKQYSKKYQEEKKKDPIWVNAERKRKREYMRRKREELIKDPILLQRERERKRIYQRKYRARKKKEKLLQESVSETVRV